MLVRLSIILILLISQNLSFTKAQTGFSADEYYQYINDITDMESQELLSMYPPKTSYWSQSNIPADLESFKYLDSIQIKLGLTDDELTALQNQLFVVTERLSYVSMGEAYISVFRNDLPVFVSTDAILHALHRSYDEILKNLEIGILAPDLHVILDAMYGAYPVILSRFRYRSKPAMTNTLRDVDLYITMAKSLLDGSPATPHLISTDFFNQYWDAVQSERFVSMPLFTDTPRDLDFSQFTVRGHYADSIELSRYFQAMMWLGRIDFLLSQPPVALSEEDILRMNMDAVLMDELLELSGERTRLDGTDEIIKFMVGESDNLTTGELRDIIAAEAITGADDLLNGSVFASFQNAIEISPLSEQKILSNIFIYDLTTEPSTLPVSFKLLGQRFIIDSYVFSSVVFPKIRYQGENIWRPMPDPLDAMFALGNDDALQLIKDDLDTYKYSSSLAGVRYLIDSYDEGFWSKSLYNNWLNAIRALNPPEDDNNLPFFMKTTGWHQQKLNTQLASWSQLRHDNILNAKQSYTGGSTCYYPHGYVEPYPEFYNQIGAFAERAGAFFAKLGVENSNIENIVNFYAGFAPIADTLETLALKELNGTPFNESDIDFLKRVVTSQWQPAASSPAVPADGWYIKLFFGDEFAASRDAYENDFIVADVHTQPTDEDGGIVGRVLHVGLGKVNLGVYLIEDTPSGDSPIAYVGPALSYYEHITNNFDRLTDKTWSTKVFTNDIPLRPDWVNSYLMDGAGSRFPIGREIEGKIFVGIDNPNRSQISSFILHQNYPNPFNPETIIEYDLPIRSKVKLIIYNIRGEEVALLINGSMSAGNHRVSWNASRMASGIYVYKLQVGEFIQTKKMVLLK